MSAQMIAEHRMVDNDGVRLALSVVGAGPDVLFVHGLGSAQVLWQPFISELSGRYRCWNLDVRGHGASDRAPGTYTIRHYASDVAAALNHIGRPVLGVGHSLGGRCFTELGVAGVADLHGIYVLDSGVRPPTEGQSGTHAIFLQQLAMLQEFQPAKRPVSDYEAVLAAAPNPVGGTNRETMLAEQLRGRAESLSQLDPGCIEALVGGSLGGGRVDPAVAIPMRVIAADPGRGASFGPEDATVLLALTPHAEIRTVLGVGHQLMMMRGFDQEILSDLRDWLKRMSAP